MVLYHALIPAFSSTIRNHSKLSFWCERPWIGLLVNCLMVTNTLFFKPGVVLDLCLGLGLPPRAITLAEKTSKSRFSSSTSGASILQCTWQWSRRPTENRLLLHLKSLLVNSWSVPRQALFLEVWLESVLLGGEKLWLLEVGCGGAQNQPYDNTRVR